MYGTLCALATFPRAAIKARISENSVFGAYMEQEPYIRELVEAYTNSSFKTVLDILSRYSVRPPLLYRLRARRCGTDMDMDVLCAQTRHYADIHLAPHVQELTQLIRNRAVVLYFQPFASIKLDRMSAAFGWTIDEVEQHVVGLIQAGDIQGRVDSQNKVSTYPFLSFPFLSSPYDSSQRD